MVVLGVDPGSVVTGWGIIEATGRSTLYIASGCIRTHADTPLPTRLGEIFTRLGEVIIQYQPNVAAVEEVFMATNAQSALKLGQARGAAIAAIGHQGLSIFEYTALQIKKSVVGYGRAEKNQVREMVRMLLSINKSAPSIPQDASDALGCALCHLHTTSGVLLPIKGHL
ncbi:MAG: crossover junction endodeoxyribonuclease RuvC [Magnetococcus sp. DMHC-6]